MPIFDQQYIHFIKTTASLFASTIKDDSFKNWLYEVDSNNNYINIEGTKDNPIVDSSGNVTLKSTRNRNYPILSLEKDPALYSLYFLDDIKLLYAKGIPYDSNNDYITGAKIVDSNPSGEKQPYIDSENHILCIPKDAFDVKLIIDKGNDSSGGSSTFLGKPLHIRYWNGSSATADVTYDGSKEISIPISGALGQNAQNAQNAVKLNGHDASEYTLIGTSSDSSINITTLMGLKNYVDSKSFNGGSSGGGFDDEWHGEDD